MTLQKSKTIGKILSCFGKINGFVTSNATSNTITAGLTTALTTAGNGGTAVPLQVSVPTSAPIGEEQFAPGLITTGENRVPIWNATTGKKIFFVETVGATTQDQEVYGRITELAGVYTLSYFYEDSTGTEQPFTMSGQTINYGFGYRFTFSQFPSDGFISIMSSEVYEDPSTSSRGRTVKELVTVTATNTMDDLAFTPIANSVQLFVNGHEEDSLAGGAFTMAGSAITWVPANAGYNIQTTDRVVAVYNTLQ